MISPMCKKLVAPRISPIFVLVFMSIYDNRFQIQLITATLENSLPHGSSNIPTEIIDRDAYPVNYKTNVRIT